MKTTKEDFALYKRWQKYILDTQPKLTKGIVRPTLIAFCLALAIHGSNGHDCYVSNAKLAPKVGVDRDRLGKYRDEALRLGWFTPTGERAGRVEKLNVSIPDEPVSESASEPAETASQASAHIASSDVVSETACQCLGCIRGDECFVADANG